MNSATTSSADVLIFDLEDSVPSRRKAVGLDAVIDLVHALPAERRRWVRINPGPAGLREADAVVDDPAGPDPLPPMSYTELDLQVRRIATTLAARVPVGGRVAVIAPNSARLLQLMLAVPASGRILVPINFRLNAAEITYILEHSGADVVLADPQLEPDVLAALPEHQLLGPATDQCWQADAPVPELRRLWDPDEDLVATINYTSGTTARPKGVALTHRAIWLDAVMFGLHATVTDQDRYLHTLPLFHVNGWGLPYTMAGLGVTQYLQRRIDGAAILDRIRADDITLMACAPAVLGIILDALEHGEPPSGRNQVRVICAGAPPPSRIIERVEHELGWEFIQIYGLTETAPLVTINRRPPGHEPRPPAQRAEQLAAAGAPCLGTRISLSPTGEVLVRSNHVLSEYRHDPQATADALADGWFHTGDGGTIDSAGRLTILDRKKDVIITGGENVSSAEVESALYRHPAVKDVAVIGVPDHRWGEAVKAVIVLKADQAAEEADLIAFARAALTHYKCPTSIDIVTDIPRTATGKIQKFKLREPYWLDLPQFREGMHYEE
ncbi:MAG: AMP-dependent synthetase [Pseudonocardiales bacterium]|nr:MAG: AMP-dependent synthetase [Pseudonocardiales bacterium]